MNGWTFPGACGVLAVLIIGFGEGITWIIVPVCCVAVAGVALFLLRGQMSRVPRFHGHGDTRARAMRHERGHVAVLNGLGVGATRPKVWKESGGWAGVVYPKDKARWNRLSRVEQAAVYVAGALATGTDAGCGPDLTAMEQLASRRAAEREARRYL